MQVSAGAGQNLARLMEIVSRLRSPSGCLWDREQNKQDIARYLLEEAYEVVDAIENRAPAELQEELGDLLFHIIFLADLAQEKAEFDLTDVMAGITEKMIRRHPHVFSAKSVASVAAIKENWDIIKKQEGKNLGTYQEQWKGIAKDLPALIRAQKITQTAAKVGFDWENTEGVLKKVEEELAELKEAMQTCRQELIAEEMGDLLFSLVNLCRFLDVDAEASLRGASHKFVQRFAYIEAALLKVGKQPATTTPAEMDRLWEEAKLR
ncbi:MAG: nucleoside triphosphate pyrophosphohydrolase [Deltaproteobacteria bacterium]|nr:nucleoside triphosphate pyrophosphohydrolase [Deltaproteobacteria bacterium]